MRVCWDAEVGVRAPCGALSTQDSPFLPILRIIMRVPDGALLGELRTGGLPRRLELEAERVFQEDRGRADQARVAVAGPHVGEDERARLLALRDCARPGDLAVADDLDARADALARRTRDGGLERDAAAGAEQPE